MIEKYNNLPTFRQFNKQNNQNRQQQKYKCMIEIGNNVYIAIINNEVSLIYQDMIQMYKQKSAYEKISCFNEKQMINQQSRYKNKIENQKINFQCYGRELGNLWNQQYIKYLFNKQNRHLKTMKSKQPILTTYNTLFQKNFCQYSLCCPLCKNTYHIFYQLSSFYLQKLLKLTTKQPIQFYKQALVSFLQIYANLKNNKKHQIKIDTNIKFYILFCEQCLQYTIIYMNNIFVLSKAQNKRKMIVLEILNSLQKIFYQFQQVRQNINNIKQIIDKNQQKQHQKTINQIFKYLNQQNINNKKFIKQFENNNNQQKMQQQLNKQNENNIQIKNKKLKINECCKSASDLLGINTFSIIERNSQQKQSFLQQNGIQISVNLKQKLKLVQKNKEQKGFYKVNKGRKLFTERSKYKSEKYKQDYFSIDKFTHRSTTKKPFLSMAQQVSNICKQQNKFQNYLNKIQQNPKQHKERKMKRYNTLSNSSSTIQLLKQNIRNSTATKHIKQKVKIQNNKLLERQKQNIYTSRNKYIDKKLEIGKKTVCVFDNIMEEYLWKKNKNKSNKLNENQINEISKQIIQTHVKTTNQLTTFDLTEPSVKNIQNIQNNIINNKQNILKSQKSLKNSIHFEGINLQQLDNQNILDYKCTSSKAILYTSKTLEYIKNMSNNQQQPIYKSQQKQATYISKASQQTKQTSHNIGIMSNEKSQIIDNFVLESNNKPQCKFQQFWQKIQKQVLNNIDEIGQAISQLKQFYKKYKIKSIIQLYLLYKKFFYKRTALIAALLDKNQPIFGNNQTISEWQKIHSQPLFINKVKSLEQQNKQILNNLQKMYKKVLQKQKKQYLSYNIHILDIAIQDEQIYHEFIIQMLKINTTKVKQLTKTIQKQQKQSYATLHKYIKIIMLATLDEISESHYQEVNEWINQDIDYNSISNKIRQLQLLYKYLQ